MLTFCNSYILWLLCCVQLRLVTVTFSDVYVCDATFCSSTHFFLCQAVALVAKTRWDRYRLHMMPLYQFDNDQVMINAHDVPDMNEILSSAFRLRWRQNVLKTLKPFMLLSWWCSLGVGNGLLPVRELTIMNRLIPILTPLCFHETVPLIIFLIFEDDLEAELLESPERERIGASRGRRDFGTCQVNFSTFEYMYCSRTYS